MTSNDCHPSFHSGSKPLAPHHQKLLDLCQQAKNLPATPKLGKTEAFHRILNDLAVYAQDYFRKEENLLRARHPERLAKHISEHIWYEKQLTELLMCASSGILDEKRLLDFLTEWWALHVLCSEKPVDNVKI